jgi:predicted Fe-Mo cluster-binding NifX family protein
LNDASKGLSELENLMRNILFVTDPITAGGQVVGTWPPLHMAYLAGAALNAVHEAKIYDAMNKRHSEHITKKKWRYTMKVCFPVVNNQGLASQVFNHFGSAPEFVIVDMVSNEFLSVINSDNVHEHGACNPVAGLGGHHVDAIVVGGIGGGALHKLNSSGIRAFKASGGSIAENVEMFNLGALQEYKPGHTCGGHGLDHGCSH